jgi:hypothetical protein
MSEIAKMIAAIEARLTKRGWSERRIATEVCLPAGVNPHTWRRWRNGEHEPNMATWRRVEEALKSIEGGRGGRLDQRRRGAAKAVSR